MTTNNVPSHATRLREPFSSAAFEVAASGAGSGSSSGSGSAPGAPSTPDYENYTPTLSEPLEVPLVIDDENVQAQVTMAGGSAAAVGAHHGDLHDAAHEGRRSRHIGLRDRAREEHRHIGAFVLRLGREMSGLAPFVDLPGEKTPWPTGALVKFGLHVVVAAGLLGVGVVSMATIVEASGLPGFEDSWRAYVFSLVPIATAFAAKSCGNLFTLESSLRRYTAFLHVVGVLLGAGWATLFCLEFGPTMGQSVEETLALALADGAGADRQQASSGTGVLLIGVLAEVALSSGQALMAERIWAQFGASRRVPNQRHAIVAKALGYWNAHLTRIAAIARELDGRVRALDKSRAAFVGRARDAYELRRRGIDIYLGRDRDEAND